MKTENHVITLKSKNPPVVELDSAAMAAYVRFSRRKVARTEVLDSRKSTVTVDFDTSGEVIASRRCFGQRLPLTAGFLCPAPNLFGRIQSRILSGGSAQRAMSCGRLHRAHQHDSCRLVTSRRKPADP